MFPLTCSAGLFGCELLSIGDVCPLSIKMELEGTWL